MQMQLASFGIAQRDFKPENILLTKDNQILKIIDFWLSNTYTKGQFLQTCIWSPGVILYLVLCGKYPFYDDNQILYEKILVGKNGTLEHLSTDVLDFLSKILD